MNEFETIAKYFRPLTQGHDLLQDDAAVLSVPPGHELVVTSDTLNEGTHFMVGAAPADIAHKALRVNLSDLAAMGADPLAYQLNIAFPGRPDESWLADFTAALLADQKQFGIYCSGGDTTTIDGSLSLSITAMGIAPTGKALRRNGAKPGDHIILTGAVGDALTGLQVLQGKIKTNADDYFAEAYYRPVPRIGVVKILRDHVHAAIDISDGLVADLTHICAASGCRADIHLVPGIFSEKGGTSGLPPEELLTGGDDYELLLAVPPGQSGKFLAALSEKGLRPVKIGEFTGGHPGVTVFNNGKSLTLKTPGWTHF